MNLYQLVAKGTSLITSQPMEVHSRKVFITSTEAFGYEPEFKRGCADEPSLNQMGPNISIQLFVLELDGVAAEVQNG